MYHTLEADYDDIVCGKGLPSTKSAVKAEAAKASWASPVPQQHPHQQPKSKSSSTSSLKNEGKPVKLGADTHRDQEDADGTADDASESSDGKTVHVDNEAEYNHVLHKQMDHVLRTLKNEPEHATPFMRPVTVKIAPNYFDVIKEPMDLSTVSRRLQQGAYTGNLAAFTRDISLIFSNCREYNCDDEDNEFGWMFCTCNVLMWCRYVASADIMETKMNVLLADLPVIRIRSKSRPASPPHDKHVEDEHASEPMVLLLEPVRFSTLVVDARAEAWRAASLSERTSAVRARRAFLGEDPFTTSLNTLLTSDISGTPVVFGHAAVGHKDG